MDIRTHTQFAIAQLPGRVQLGLGTHGLPGIVSTKFSVMGSMLWETYAVQEQNKDEDKRYLQTVLYFGYDRTFFEDVSTGLEGFRGSGAHGPEMKV